MIIELEARRLIKRQIRDYLKSRLIPEDALRYDYKEESWVVGCFTVGKTLPEAKTTIVISYR